MSGPRKRRSAAGFTLIELMVTAAVGLLLLAGAFEMHAAFSRQSVRQQEISDMQQALRVASQVIGRSIRDAGTGLFGGTMQVYNGGYFMPQACPLPTGTVPTPDPFDPFTSCFWAVQFSNRGGYANPKPTYDVTASGDNDPDEDWLRIVSFDANTAVRVTVPYDHLGHLQVTDTRNFTDGGFFFIGNTYPAFTDASGKATLGWRTGCVRHLFSVTPAPNPSSPTATPGTLSFFGDLYNPAEVLDLCVPSVFAGLPGQSRTAYVFPIDRSVVFRIQPGTTAPVVTPPQLQAWYSTPLHPTFIPNSPPNFQTLTENIEHMQIALVLTDGTICGDATNSIDVPGNVPGTCNFQNARAVRLTLVARSSSAWPGWLSQGFGGGRFWEDERQPAQSDGYLRRALTTEIEIRNNPWGAQ